MPGVNDPPGNYEQSLGHAFFMFVIYPMQNDSKKTKVPIWLSKIGFCSIFSLSFTNKSNSNE